MIHKDESKYNKSGQKRKGNAKIIYNLKIIRKI